MYKYIVFYVSILVAVVSASLSWYKIVYNILHVNAYSWLNIAITLSIMAVALILSAFVTQRLWHISIAAFIVFLSAFFFAPSISVFVVLLIAVGLITLMTRAVHRSMQRHIHIHLPTHMKAGSTYLVSAIALMISVVFYATIVRHDAAQIIFSRSLQSTLAGPIASVVLPAPLEEGSGAKGEVTVDDFIAYVVRNSSTQDEGSPSLRFLEDYASAISARFKGLNLERNNTEKIANTYHSEVQQSVIAHMRSALAQELGMSLDGSEPATQVFALLLERYVQSFAEHKILPHGYKFSKALAGVIAFFLFITVTWIGSFVKVAWIWLAHGLFVLLRKSGIIRIAYTTVQKEYIA